MTSQVFAGNVSGLIGHTFTLKIGRLRKLSRPPTQTAASSAITFNARGESAPTKMCLPVLFKIACLIIYLKRFNITYPNGPDLGSRISAIFNRNLGVPETYFIDRNGIMRSIKIGPFTSVSEIKASIDPLLADSNSTGE